MQVHLLLFLNIDEIPGNQLWLSHNNDSMHSHPHRSVYCIALNWLCSIWKREIIPKAENSKEKEKKKSHMKNFPGKWKNI